MEYIIADNNGHCLGYLDGMTSVDVDTGDTNDFEMVLSQEYASKIGVQKGYRFFVPNTEFGGIIEDIQSNSQQSDITYRGYSWRGYLEHLIIQPTTGSNVFAVSGDANDILRLILNIGTGLLFTVPEEKSGIAISGYSFSYDTALSGINKMLSDNGARLDIKAVEVGNGEPFKVMIRAVKINNYSEELQYDGDDNIQVSVRDYCRGINHLICLGDSDAETRTVLHLYAQLDGTVGTAQYYTGIAERTAVMESSSAEQADILQQGTEKLKELMNYKEADMSIDEVELELYDVVSARDRNAGIVMSRPVIDKVLKYSDGKETISYKLKGE